MKQENYAMLCDFYEFTMSNGYFRNGFYQKTVYFDVFFRDIPDGGGFAIAAGLEQVIDYVKELHFTEEDIAFLRSKQCFDEGFLTYLKEFHFSGDIWAVPEGTPVFPNEPIMTIRAPAIEAQLLETFILLSLNHQSLIATKANRIVRAADGRTILEFGSRRAQGASGAILGARAAYIGGCAGTACTLTDELYGVPAGGTMAHSWVQMFDTEYEAFKAYCENYPHQATLLVETYNTLKSALPIEQPDGTIVPKIKISENITKITNPHFKKVYRFYDKETGKAIADELCLHTETIDDSQPHTIFDPIATWKTKEMTNYTIRELLVPIFKNGVCVYEQPSLSEICQYCKEQIALLWDEVKRFENPHNYYVDLSQALWEVKQDLLKKNR